MKKYKTAIIVGIAALIIVIAFLASLIIVKNKLSGKDSKSGDNNVKTEKVNNDTVKTKLVKSGMSTVLSAAAGKDVDVNKYIEENMSVEDATFVNEMLQEKVDSEMVMKLVEAYASDGDISRKSLKELLRDLTPEEKEKLEELFDQYGDDFLKYIDGN